MIRRNSTTSSNTATTAQQPSVVEIRQQQETAQKPLWEGPDQAAATAPAKIDIYASPRLKYAVRNPQTDEDTASYDFNAVTCPNMGILVKNDGYKAYVRKAIEGLKKNYVDYLHVEPQKCKAKSDTHERMFLNATKSGHFQTPSHAIQVALKLEKTVTLLDKEVPEGIKAEALRILYDHLFQHRGFEEVYVDKALALLEAYCGDEEEALLFRARKDLTESVISEHFKRVEQQIKFPQGDEWALKCRTIMYARVAKTMGLQETGCRLREENWCDAKPSSYGARDDPEVDKMTDFVGEHIQELISPTDILNHIRRQYLEGLNQLMQAAPNDGRALDPGVYESEDFLERLQKALRPLSLLVDQAIGIDVVIKKKKAQLDKGSAREESRRCNLNETNIKIKTLLSEAARNKFNFEYATEKGAASIPVPPGFEKIERIHDDQFLVVDRSATPSPKHRLSATFLIEHPNIDCSLKQKWDILKYLEGRGAGSGFALTRLCLEPDTPLAHLAFISNLPKAAPEDILDYFGMSADKEAVQNPSFRPKIALHEAIRESRPTTAAHIFAQFPEEIQVPEEPEGKKKKTAGFFALSMASWSALNVSDFLTECAELKVDITRIKSFLKAFVAGSRNPDKVYPLYQKLNSTEKIPLSHDDIDKIFGEGMSSLNPSYVSDFLRNCNQQNVGIERARAFIAELALHYKPRQAENLILLVSSSREHGLKPAYLTQAFAGPLANLYKKH